MGIFQSVFLFLSAFIMGRAAAAVENLGLRQQVAVFKQSVKRPKLRPRDRVFWVQLSRLWRNWRSWNIITEKETIRGSATRSSHLGLKLAGGKVQSSAGNDSAACCGMYYYRGAA